MIKKYINIFFINGMFRARNVIITSDTNVVTFAIKPLHQVLFYSIVIIFIGFFTFFLLKSTKLYNTVDAKARKIEQMMQEDSYTKKELESMITQIDKINDYFLKMQKRKLNFKIQNTENIEYKDEDVESLFADNKDKSVSKKKNKKLEQVALISELINMLQSKLSTWYVLAYYRYKDIISILNTIGVGNCSTNTWFNMTNRFIKKLTDFHLPESEDETMKALQGDVCSLNVVQSLNNDYKVSKSGKDISYNFIDSIAKVEDLIFSIPFGNPMPDYLYFSGKFGNRVDPLYNTKAFHFGQDIVGQYGTNITSTAKGTVIRANFSDTYGNVVYIDHGKNIVTRYAHLDSINVRLGQKVEVGTVIGHEGSSGKSVGAHLHYEIRINNVAINPMLFIRGER